MFKAGDNVALNESAVGYPKKVVRKEAESNGSRTLWSVCRRI